MWFWSEIFGIDLTIAGMCQSVWSAVVTAYSANSRSRKYSQFSRSTVHRLERGNMSVHKFSYIFDTQISIFWKILSFSNAYDSIWTLCWITKIQLYLGSNSSKISFRTRIVSTSGGNGKGQEKKLTFFPHLASIKNTPQNLQRSLLLFSFFRHFW